MKNSATEVGWCLFRWSGSNYPCSLPSKVSNVQITNHVPNRIGGEKCRLFDLISRETFKLRSTHEHTKMTRREKIIFSPANKSNSGRVGKSTGVPEALPTALISHFTLDIQCCNRGRLLSFGQLSYLSWLFTDTKVYGISLYFYRSDTPLFLFLHLEAAGQKRKSLEKTFISTYYTRITHLSVC